MSYNRESAGDKVHNRPSPDAPGLDPGTFRLLSACGVAGGWHCLEVGAGGGSIVRWLSRTVGEGGEVVAIDLDTGSLDAHQLPNVKVLRQDVARMSLRNQFDLVHGRLVLAQIRSREAVMAKMAAALKAGGILLCEELDDSQASLLSPGDQASQELFLKVNGAFARIMEAFGYDSHLGRDLPALFKTVGLTKIDWEGRPFVRDYQALNIALQTVARLGPRVVQLGLATPADLDNYASLVSLPNFSAVTGTVVAVWGQCARSESA